MKLANRIWTALAIGLALLVVAQLTQLSRDAAFAPLEPSKYKTFEVAEDTAEFLNQLDDEILLTYYATPHAALPSRMRHLRTDVELVLQQLAHASQGKLRFEVIVPEERPELREYLTELGLSSFRARSVEHDGWSESEVWSSLRIARGTTNESILHAITPEMVPGLQRLIVEQSRAQNRTASITLAAPAGEFRGLEELLATRGQVTRIDLDGAPDSLPVNSDLLFWMNPNEGSAAHLRVLANHVDAGRPLVLAAAPFGSENASFETLFAEYGVPIAEGVVRNAVEPGAALVCTAHEQDFRPLGAQPNGNLSFAAPRLLQLDPANLQEHNRTAHTLASSTSNSTGGARQPLLLLLASDDPFRGSLVFAASSTPFSDAALADDTSAHRGLVRLLVEELAPASKLVWNRASLRRSENLGELPPRERALWRGFTLLLVPAILLLLAALRLARSASLLRSATGTRPVRWPIPIALSACGALTFVTAQLGLKLDATTDQIHSISAEEIQLLQQAVSAQPSAAVEFFLSPPADLPNELRLVADRAEALCRELAQRVSKLEFARPSLAEAQSDPRLAPRLVTSKSDEVTRVRRVLASLRIRLGSESEVLSLTESADYENLRFRIAFAFWKLSQARSIRVAVAASAGRLSAAEGEFDYRSEGLFAPTEGDPFAHARRLLERNGFELTALNPAAPEIDFDPDLVLWLQPRRDTGPMLRYATQELARGGNVLLAAQHYEILPRQLRRDEMELSFWPRPQHTDLERNYLPGLGIELDRNLFFDEESVPLTLETRIERRLERGSGGHELEAQFSAQPFLVRALAAGFGRHVITRGLGDLVLHSPSRIRFESELGEPYGIHATPLVRSTENTWQHDWKGGNLAPELLNGPIEIADRHMPFRRELATLFEGRFPEARLERVRSDDGTEREFYSPGPAHSGPTGKLLLVGCSSMFEDSALANEDFDNGQFLLHSVIGLTLGEDFASIASRRLVSSGFERPASSSRFGWRVFVLGAGPLWALLLALGVLVTRSRARISAQ